MREIQAEEITKAIAAMCVEANQKLPPDVSGAILAARDAEPFPPARETLQRLAENMALAGQTGLPLCQDTGLAFVFVELGQDVHIAGGFLGDAVDEGVRRGYKTGRLRASVVADPLRRANTGDNTPALLHVDVVLGEAFAVTLAPKGFGSENMSRIAMLPPSAGEAGVRQFITDTVKAGGANACPPLVVGVGLGGSFDRAALLAKKALLRPLDKPNPDPYYAAFEQSLLAEINALGIGPEGFGGQTTALGLAIEVYPTHIAGLPVAVNMCCHAARHLRAEL